MYLARSISLDLLPFRAREKHYEKHLQKMDEIKGENFCNIMKESKKISETLHKAHTQAR
jgi:hypothetical protein